MRKLAVWTVVLAAMALGLSEVPASALPKPAAATSAVLLGAHVAPGPGQSVERAYTDLEASMGRHLGGVRSYQTWDSQFPTPFDNWVVAGGRSLFLNVDAILSDGSYLRWADIADAPVGSALDQTMTSWAQRIAAFPHPVYLTFFHEPEVKLHQVNNGKPKDFVAAWRRVWTTFHDAGVTNVTWVFNMTAFAFTRSDGSSAHDFYPGDAYVDDIGGDGYVADGCRIGSTGSYASFADVFEGLRLFGEAHPTKGLMAPELGVLEDPASPGRKAAWLADMEKVVTQPEWAQFKAVLYYDQPSPDWPLTCVWNLTTSKSALEAWDHLAKDSYWQARSLTPLAAPNAVVTGIVRGPAGAALRQTIVRVIDPATGTFVVRGRTDGTGRYSFDLISGTYVLRVEPPPAIGSPPVSTTVTVGTSTQEVDLSLPKATLTSLSGTITAQGMTASTEYVALDTDGGQEVDSSVTHFTGAFAVSAAAGSYRIRIHSTGIKPFPPIDATSTVDVPLHGSNDWTVALPLGAVTVDVVDPSGAPVYGAAATLACTTVTFDLHRHDVPMSGTECLGRGLTDSTTPLLFYSLPTTGLSMVVDPPAGSGLTSRTISGINLTGSAQTLTVQLSKS